MTSRWLSRLITVKRSGGSVLLVLFLHLSGPVHLSISRVVTRPAEIRREKEEKNALIDAAGAPTSRR